MTWSAADILRLLNGRYGTFLQFKDYLRSPTSLWGSAGGSESSSSSNLDCHAICNPKLSQNRFKLNILKWISLIFDTIACFPILLQSLNV